MSDLHLDFQEELAQLRVLADRMYAVDPVRGRVMLLRAEALRVALGGEPSTIPCETVY